MNGRPAWVGVKSEMRLRTGCHRSRRLPGSGSSVYGSLAVCAALSVNVTVVVAPWKALPLTASRLAWEVSVLFALSGDNGGSGGDGGGDGGGD